MTTHPTTQQCSHVDELDSLISGRAAAVWAYRQGIQIITEPTFVLMSADVDPLRWYEEVLPCWARATWRRLHSACSSTPAEDVAA